MNGLGDLEDLDPVLMIGNAEGDEERPLVCGRLSSHKGRRLLTRDGWRNIFMGEDFFPLFSFPASSIESSSAHLLIAFTLSSNSEFISFSPFSPEGVKTSSLSSTKIGNEEAPPLMRGTTEPSRSQSKFNERRLFSWAKLSFNSTFLVRDILSGKLFQLGCQIGFLQ